jgi:hypothetical protein
MSNIEMHGFFFVEKADNNWMDKCVAKSVETKKAMLRALEDATYFDEVVVTEILSSVEDKNEKSQPFLRIWATKQDEVDDILRRFEDLDVDIEVPPLLAKFVQKRSARSQEEPGQGTLFGDIVTELASAGAG